VGHPRGKQGTDGQMGAMLFDGDRAWERKQRSGKVGDDRWGRPGPLCCGNGFRRLHLSVGVCEELCWAAQAREGEGRGARP